MNQEEYHSRWDEEHRRVCEDCYSDWCDEMLDMTRDAEIGLAQLKIELAELEKEESDG